MLLWIGSFRLRGFTLSRRAPLLCRNGREIGIAVVHSLSWSGKGREAIEGRTYLYCLFVGRHLSGGREIRSLPICLVRAVVNNRLLAPSLVLPNYLNLHSPLDTALSGTYNKGLLILSLFVRFSEQWGEGSSFFLPFRGNSISRQAQAYLS